MAQIHESHPIFHLLWDSWYSYSLCTKNRIQISQSTYDLLVAAGKETWTRPRSDQVTAKGKGVLKTYWLDPKPGKGAGSVTGSSDSGYSNSAGVPSNENDALFVMNKKRVAKQERLVTWIVEMLGQYLLKVVTLRKSQSNNLFKPTSATIKTSKNHTSLDEVAEVIYLPRFDKKNFEEATRCKRQQASVSDEVLEELKEYVSAIAASYLDNPFHNFEVSFTLHFDYSLVSNPLLLFSNTLISFVKQHACHVTQSTHKLLTRIVSKDVGLGIDENGLGGMASKLHDYTLGINSDPLTSLAILFSALIHDAGHRGVSNAQLISEDKEMGDKYRNKSVAEQHSLDSCWDLLMTEGKFEALRSCLFTTEAEMKRFRQVLVNVVLATDIFDKVSMLQSIIDSFVVCHERRIAIFISVFPLVALTSFNYP